MRSPSFNIKGSKTAAFCKHHTNDSMVNIRNKPCSRDSCTNRPFYSAKVSKTVMCCKRHA